MATIINTAEMDPESLNPSHALQVYNGLDVCVTFEVLETIEQQLDETTQSIYDFERALQAPVMEMNMRGILVDQTERLRVLNEYRRDIKRLEEQFYELVRDGVGYNCTNWRSHPQIKTLFYDVLGLKPIKKAGKTTDDRDALEHLEQYFIAEPFAKHLLKLRDLDKARGWLETGIDPDGRMRTQFNIAGTNTGRFSSAESVFATGGNQQNIDSRYRNVLVADEGMKFANLDLEQADSRNVGAVCWNLFHESHGPEFAGAYLDACESGDLHTRVCNMAWTNLNWPDDPDEWRAIADELAYREMSYRDLAKRLGHGTNFLGTPRTMAKHTHVPVPMIQDFQKRYFVAFPCIREWHKHIAREIGNKGQLTTLLNRRRFFWGRRDDQATLREATAYEPQSLTADEINKGLLNVWRGNRVQLLSQVHDSILIQYPEEVEDEIVPWALEQLRNTIPLVGGREFSVPTEAKVGWNYGDHSEKNPDGLRKWKGGDDRKRQYSPQTKLSIKGM